MILRAAFVLLVVAGVLAVVWRLGHSDRASREPRSREEAMNPHSPGERAGRLPAGEMNGPAVEAVNAFALDLYARLRPADGNLFFSPYSVASVLAVTFAGARGETRKQMARTLHFAPEGGVAQSGFAAIDRDLKAGAVRSGYRLDLAGALWGQRGFGFREEFLRQLKEGHGAGLLEADFQGDREGARRAINDWASRETGGRITDLVLPNALGPLTRLVLTHAVYFKGSWATPFDPAETGAGPFRLAKDRTVGVPLMRRTGQMNYFESRALQALELPYVGGDLSMVVLLPRQRNGIAELERSITVESLRTWLAGLRARSVDAVLPKLTLSWGSDLARTLSAMGMPDVFDQEKADFSGMNGNVPEPLRVAAVIHKAFAQVNEEGTEAAASTAVEMAMRSMPETATVFRADHPFVFLIRDNRSGVILFMGRVADPK